MSKTPEPFCFERWFWDSRTSGMGGILENCHQGSMRGFPKIRVWDGSRFSGPWECQGAGRGCAPQNPFPNCKGNRNFSKERLLDYFDLIRAIQSLSITEKNDKAAAVQTPCMEKKLLEIIKI